MTFCGQAVFPTLGRPSSAGGQSLFDLAIGLLAMAGLLVLVSSLIWSRHRARTTGEPDRLRPFLLNGALSIPALTAWLTWLLARLAPLNPADRLLVAFAVAWVLAPFAALALSAAGEALTRNRSR